MLRTKRSRRNLIWNRQRINCGIRVAAVLARDIFLQDGFVMCTVFAARPCWQDDLVT